MSPSNDKCSFVFFAIHTILAFPSFPPLPRSLSSLPLEADHVPDQRDRPAVPDRGGQRQDRLRDEGRRSGILIAC